MQNYKFLLTDTYESNGINDIRIFKVLIDVAIPMLKYISPQKWCIISLAVIYGSL